MFDPGYMNTAPCKSKISYIDGDAGILRYRGYPIEVLAEKSSYLESAFALVYGDLPDAAQLREWEETIARHSALPVPVIAAIEALPHDAHPMGVILAGLKRVIHLPPRAEPRHPGRRHYRAHGAQDKQIVRIIGKMTTLAAHAYHRNTGRAPAHPNQKLGYAENFLYMLDAGLDPDHRPNPRLAKALDVMFLLHAEHEMNCSTAAARHLASSGVDVYSAVAGAVGALYGPLHGGANEAVLKMRARIGDVEAIPAFLDGVKRKKERMFGFGHRVYKNFDPRANVIRRVAEGSSPSWDATRSLTSRLRLRRLRETTRTSSNANSTPTWISTADSSTAPWDSSRVFHRTLRRAQGGGVPRALAREPHGSGPEDHAPAADLPGRVAPRLPGHRHPTARQRRSDVAGGTIERVEETPRRSIRAGVRRRRRGDGWRARGRLRSRVRTRTRVQRRRRRGGRDERRGRARSARVKRRDDPSRRAFA